LGEKGDKKNIEIHQEMMDDESSSAHFESENVNKNYNKNVNIENLRSNI
tara:strand:+ start:1271 stop:1417 length:147 start_codon:yes stop_codon:yes gene_type:complete